MQVLFCMLRRGTLDTGICFWVNDGFINGQQQLLLRDVIKEFFRECEAMVQLKDKVCVTSIWNPLNNCFWNWTFQGNQSVCGDESPSVSSFSLQNFGHFVMQILLQD